jgi:TP901 family phage tail tape measure protein
MAGENINRRLNIYINDKEVVNSMSGITREMAKTRNEIRHLNKGADDYNERLAKLKDTYNKLSHEQEKFKKSIAETPSILQKIKSALGPVATGIITAFSIGSVVNTALAALGNAKRLVFDFEQSLADLSSITGATGKDLKFLKNAAIDLGESTVGGAIAVVEAYKLIASAKPELLENVSALNQVTEATLLLAKASGMDLPEAATALTDAMNQFGVDASQATVFVDALANGAKYGAAEIPQVTESLLKFGAVARSSNIDVKQSVALVELLAENGLKGAEAGTALRNVLLKLSAPDALPKEARAEMERLGISMNYLKDKTIPIQEKLEALKPLLKDNASIVKVFGTENATAAINVLAHTDRLKELASKMGEVGTAEEQAAIKMDTVNGKTDLLISKYDSLILSIGTGSGVVSGFFKFFIDGASDALTGLIRLNKSWDELHGKARQDGASEGSKSFAKRMSIGQNQGGNELDVAKNIKTPALITYKKLMEEYKKNEEDVKKFQGQSAFLGLGEGHFSKVANEKKEALLKEINLQVALIREANKKIDEITNPKKKAEIKADTATGISEDDQKEQDKAAKKRDKDLEDAKKHHEDLLKELEKSQKELLDTQRLYQDNSLDNQKESYEKELKLLNVEYDRKIEDSKLKVGELQTEIDKLNQESKDPKNTASDIEVINAIIAQKVAAQKQYTNMLVTIEQTRGVKIGALQEKYLEKSFQKQQEKSASELQNLRTKQAFELAEITSFAQAKGILAKTLSSDELSKIKTLEDAKKEIKKQNLKEQYDLELKNLNALVALLESTLLANSSGITLISDEEKEKVTKFLDDAKAKIAEISGNKTDAEATPEEGKKTTGVDILGFNSNQWEEVFTNLDTFEGKIAAIQLVAGALTNAFSSYFKFLEAGEARTLAKFQKSADSKKKHLQDQLDKGAISQEVYNARVSKIDADLARKKAEIEYKQAKRQKQMAIANAIINTAVAILKGYEQLGPIGGTVAAVLIGAMGALEISTISKQPLPDKNGFKKGGFTGSGNPNDESTALGSKDYTYHKGEYVIPENVLFSNDPVVPNIVGYLEQKRQGKQPAKSEDTTATASSTNETTGGLSEAVILQIIRSLDRNSEILEKIEKDGLEAFLVNDIKTAKKIRDKIKELTKLETKQKA